MPLRCRSCLWLACHTQEEIAKAVGCSEQPVKDVISDFLAELPKNLKPAADHAVDFEVPLYNIWRQQAKTPRARRAYRQKAEKLPALESALPAREGKGVSGNTWTNTNLCSPRARG